MTTGPSASERQQQQSQPNQKQPTTTTRTSTRETLLMQKKHSTYLVMNKHRGHDAKKTNTNRHLIRVETVKQGRSSNDNSRNTVQKQMLFATYLIYSIPRPWTRTSQGRTEPIDRPRSTTTWQQPHIDLTMHTPRSMSVSRPCLSFPSSSLAQCT